MQPTKNNVSSRAIPSFTFAFPFLRVYNTCVQCISTYHFNIYVYIALQHLNRLHRTHSNIFLKPIYTSSIHAQLINVYEEFSHTYVRRLVYTYVYAICLYYSECILPAPPFFLHTHVATHLPVYVVRTHKNTSNSRIQ